MQIACTTTSAAAEVLSILLHANLRPGGAFRVTDPWPRGAPIEFTVSVNLPAAVVRHVQDIPDTRIAVERGT